MPPDVADSPPVPARDVDLAARREQRREATAKRRRRRRRILIAAPFLVVFLWAIVSYTAWMLQPTSMSFNARSVEWVRANVPFGNSIVDEIEHIYYGLNAPKKGGPQLKSLPKVGLTQPRTTRAHPNQVAKKETQGASSPPPIKPIFAHALPGEGIWKPTGPAVKGGPPLLVTTFRPELDYPGIIAYAAWFDHTRTALAFYPGRYEPLSLIHI